LFSALFALFAVKLLSSAWRNFSLLAGFIRQTLAGRRGRRWIVE
jgi:hypothetical protein